MVKVFLILALIGFSCATAENTVKFNYYSFKDISNNLNAFSKTDLDAPGPFNTRFIESKKIKFGRRHIVADGFVPDLSGLPPLILIQHGNHSHKEAHRNQAKRLASWGFLAVSMQQKNSNNWISNGKRLASMIKNIARKGRVLGRRFDRNKIILMGHSFGGSAVTIAASRGAPVRGLILLDPAVVADSVLSSMSKVKQPVMLLGADRKIFRSRKRGKFYKKIRGEMGEISIHDATHDDAQSPSMFSIYAYGIDPYTTKSKQRLFQKAITTTAISIASTKKLDFAWNHFQYDIQRGNFRKTRKRAALRSH
jgi:dienelactone hydrolase